MTEILPSRAEPTEQVAKAAWDVQERILGRMKEIRRAWIRLAEDLFLFDSARMWADLGYESLHQWMADPDVEIERSDGYLLIQIWKELVVKEGADPEVLGDIEKSKVQKILGPVRRRDVSVQQAVADAKALTRADLIERYEGSAAVQTPAGPKVDTTPHYDADAEPAWAVCHVCGSSYKVATE